MKNPESQIFENLEIDQAYKKAEREMGAAAINPDEFRGKEGFAEEKIDADERKVAEREESFKRENGPEQNQTTKLATVFEAVIYDHAERSDWFGPDAFTVKTSRFDDIINGVDVVVEFPESERVQTYLALAIDVAFGTDSETTAEKLSRIKREIDENKLTEVEYFASQHSPHSRLKKVPRVVIGAEGHTVKELSNLWLENEFTKLGKHSIQFQILEEMAMQLKAFEEYANRTGKKDIAKIYEQERRVVEKIYNKKLTPSENNKIPESAYDRDSVFYTIASQLNAFR